MMNRKELELYVHIPFCASKCHYCDFLSAPAPGSVQKAYVDKLIEEIRAAGAGCREYCVITVFLGGGTPSILEAGLMERLLGELKQSFNLDPSAEFTLEANPGTLTMDKLSCCRSFGVNRISLGLQSCDDRELKLLGRIHTFNSFLKSYEQVRMAGFTDVNVDLMSALPGQTAASWLDTLKKVVRLKPEHISAYSLILEEGTPFYKWYVEEGGGGREPLPDEEEERRMYDRTREYLYGEGYERYEISNYAKPGHACRHNLGYWTGVPYLGLGLGASSCLEGYRFRNEPDLKRYLAIPMPEGWSGQLKQDVVKQSVRDRMEEFMFLGLRLTEGVEALEFAGRFGRDIRDVYGPVLDGMKAKGLLTVEGGRIRLTALGVDVSNYVMSEFLLSD